jgi:hypothetical protein
MATTFTEAQMGKAGAIENIDPTKKPGRSQMFIMERTIDFDALATSTGQALATSDVYPIFPVKVGDIIVTSGICVLTAATGASDLDWGFTGGDTTVLCEAFIANDNGEAWTVTNTQLNPVRVITADTVDIVATTATLAGAVLKFWMLVLRTDKGSVK